MSWETRARALATGLLLGQRRAALPVNVLTLRHERPVRLESMQRFCRLSHTTLRELAQGSDCLRDGCMLLYRRGGVEQALVLYNDEVVGPRRRFTLAHELGHIYMGHRSDDTRFEREANAFAAHLLMPAVLVRLCVREDEGVTADELAARFGTSREMAGYRLRECRERRLVPTADELRLLRRYAPLLSAADEPVVGY